jgi:DNA-binding beta-propeller fold protein YncE
VSAAGLGAATIEVVAGPAPASTVVKLTEPFAAAVDSRGVLYICEHKGQVITAIGPNGGVSRFAGAGKPGFGGDGGQAAEALFNDPHGLLIAGKRMYVADTLNHRVRLIDMAKGAITTVAGTGERGYSGDGGPAVKAAFNGTFGIAVAEKQRKLYIADLSSRRIRMLDLKTGIVSTVAGNGATGVPEDGAVATAAPLRDPRAVAVDAKGNVYILERAGNALRVVDRAGRIRTLIAPGTVTPNLNGPKHLAVDRSGKVVVADAENHLIRTYDPIRRTLTTIAGTGEKGDRVIPNDPLKTQLNRPHGVYIHKSGDIYISDSDNHRILRLKP